MPRLPTAAIDWKSDGGGSANLNSIKRNAARQTLPVVVTDVSTGIRARIQMARHGTRCVFVCVCLCVPFLRPFTDCRGSFECFFGDISAPLGSGSGERQHRAMGWHPTKVARRGRVTHLDKLSGRPIDARFIARSHRRPASSFLFQTFYPTLI